MGEFIVHAVGPGETLSGIAAAHGVGVDGLREWNGIKDPDPLLAGQEILVHSPAEGAGAAVPENPESRAETDFPTAAATANGSQDMAGRRGGYMARRHRLGIPAFGAFAVSSAFAKAPRGTPASRFSIPPAAATPVLSPAAIRAVAEKARHGTGATGRQ